MNSCSFPSLGSFLAWVVRSFSGWSVTHLDAVAGQAETVLYTQRGSSQQIPLDGDPISVTAGHLAEQVRIRLALKGNKPQRWTCAHVPRRHRSR